MFGKNRARLEIELPSGITLVYEDEAAADGKAVPRWALMAKMRAAIGATDFTAVQALYGEKPLLLTGAQVGGDAAQPGFTQERPKPVAVKKPTPPTATPPVGSSIGAPPATPSG